MALAKLSSWLENSGHSQSIRFLRTALSPVSLGGCHKVISKPCSSKLAASSECSVCRHLALGSEERSSRKDLFHLNIKFWHAIRLLKHGLGEICNYLLKVSHVNTNCMALQCRYLMESCEKGVFQMWCHLQINFGKKDSDLVMLMFQHITLVWVNTNPNFFLMRSAIQLLLVVVRAELVWIFKRYRLILNLSPSGGDPAYGVAVCILIKHGRNYCSLKTICILKVWHLLLECCRSPGRMTTFLSKRLSKKYWMENISFDKTEAEIFKL